MLQNNPRSVRRRRLVNECLQSLAQRPIKRPENEVLNPQHLVTLEVIESRLPNRAQKPGLIVDRCSGLVYVVCGSFIGLTVTSYFLWTRALSDVDTFLARPPSP